MLKSTYKPSPALTAPLPPGWTEHKAPTGHTYYFNASTGVSTYTRPVAAAAPLDPAASYLQHQAVPALNLSDPNVANAFMAQYNAPAAQPQQRKDEGNRRPPPQPKDRPKSKVAIPGHEPWVLVYTKYGRRFAYNPEKERSYWRIPEKLMPAVLELDRARIREKAGLPATPDTLDKKTEEKEEGPAPTAQARPDAPPPRPRSESAAPAAEAQEKEYDSDEYEEVEVTDSEGEGEDGAETTGRASKRQRTEEPAGEDQPLEFTEEDIAAQLAAMQEMEAGGGEGDWEEGDEGLPLSEADARALFKDLLDDHGINPYSSWEKLMEEGKIFDDARYTVLGSTRERKEVWEEWSRDKIRVLKEMRAKEEKKDPRIPYIQFLQEKATPKLYWPEFRRKYKKEGPMKDVGLSDKDREKWYREHINRLRLPQATLKADLRKLLESVSLRELNNRTSLGAMPATVLTDLRWISLDPKIRDPIVEAYVQALPGPPEDGEQVEGEESEERRKGREDRERREKAMRERERKVEEEKRRAQKRLEYERANMRDGERELEAAMRVGKKGLQSQLGGS